MEAWVPLFDIFLISPTPEGEASLWFQQSFDATNATSTNSFLSLLSKPVDVVVVDSSSSSTTPSSSSHSKRVMYIQTLPNAVQSRILSFLMVESQRFCARDLYKLANSILKGDKELDFWVKKAASNLFDAVSDSGFNWISSLSLGSSEERIEEEFEALPSWLESTTSSSTTALLPWLPLSYDELNSSTFVSSFVEEISDEDEMEEDKGGGRDEESNQMDVDIETVCPDDVTIDSEIQKEAAILKAQLITFESASKTIGLANGILQLCFDKAGGGGRNSLVILGLIEPWEADDENASILISNLSDGSQQEGSSWPSKVLCSVILPKLLVLSKPASRVFVTATIEFCKLHQKAAVDALLFPLIFRKEGMNTPICDVVTRIIRECLHIAHAAAFCQKVLCGEKEQRKFMCLPCHQCLISHDLADLETVARVRSKKNETNKEKSFQLFNFDSENRAEDTPTLIDRKDNVFIISNTKSKYPVLQLDIRLISDLVVVIVSATCGGIAFACAGQPVITGYLLAGSIVGPGGLSFVSEMVQVETVAQFGVIFLLFALGLEFSAAKLRVVRAVAVIGGLLQIFLFMCLCGIIASLCGGKPSEGVFVGVLLSMSSTAVVLKFLMEKNNISALHGQVTVGTLILQDCAVGLLFALLPVLGGTSGVLQGVISMTKLLVLLITFLAILSILSRTCVPWFLKLMISLSSQTNELYQLAAVAFCLLVAWCSDKLGLSLELGSFAAGVMISTTDLAQHTLEQVEPIRNFFAALFLASIGMLIHVHFLWNHVDILLASVILVIIVKTIVITIVVKGFRYNNMTSILVGMSLAQIGEFAFVLLSRASHLHLVEGKLYLLLLGTTALSLVTTPLLFKLIPAVVHLGVLLRWFTPDIIQNEIGFKVETIRTDSAKRISLMVQGDHHDS